MNLDQSERILKDFWSAVSQGADDEDPPRVLKAWADDNALCVIYTHPQQSDLILGLRRSWPPHYMNDDPTTTGRGIYTEIMEPPGALLTSRPSSQEEILWSGDLREGLPAQLEA